jgi:hypothetical protein
VFHKKKFSAVFKGKKSNIIMKTYYIGCQNRSLRSSGFLSVVIALRKS